MKLHVAAIATAAAIAGIAATSAPASAAVEVGVLSCQVAPSVGYVVASEREMRCAFRSNFGGRTQYYRGRAGRIGLDVGYTNGGTLVWNVYAPTRRIGRHALAGTYAGGSASATIGVGIGGNALVGGSRNTIALQPLSGEGSSGLNVAAGVTALSLR